MARSTSSSVLGTNNGTGYFDLNSNSSSILSVNVTALNATTPSSADNVGEEKQWPPLVQYGVPVLCLVIFIAILVVLYLFPSPKTETKNCIQRCFSKDKAAAQYSTVELQERRKQECQAMPRAHQESVNEAYDS